MLEAGASLSTADKNGKTVLHYLAQVELDNSGLQQILSLDHLKETY